MTHADIVSAIEARGGRLVYSCVLDASGRTEGEPREWNAPRRCSGCGANDHDRKRCNGPGVEPRPTQRKRNDLTAAKAELARRREERRAARRG